MNWIKKIYLNYKLNRLLNKGLRITKKLEPLMEEDSNSEKSTKLTHELTIVNDKLVKIYYKLNGVDLSILTMVVNDLLDDDFLEFAKKTVSKKSKTKTKRKPRKRTKK